MLISAKCPNCGNEDPKEFIEYDGFLGYEAVICKKCGDYADSEGEHKADNFSKDVIKNANK